MKKYFSLILFFLPALFFSQEKTSADSAYIYFQNSGKKKIAIINCSVHGNSIGLSNLKPGVTKGPVAISLAENEVFRFSCYLNKNHQAKNSIEPIDYPDQVSKEKMTRGFYIYYVNSDDENGGVLEVKLVKLDAPLPEK